MEKKRKISYSKFPFLKALKSEKILQKIIDESKKDLRFDKQYSAFLDELNQNNYINNLLNKAKNNINYFTSTYEKAILDSSDCITETLIKLSSDQNCLPAFYNIVKPIETCGIAIFNINEDPRITGHMYLIYTIYQDINNIPKIGLLAVNENKIRSNKKTIYSFMYILANKLNLIDKENLYIDCRYSGPTGANADAHNIYWLIKSLVFRKIAQTETEIVDIVDETKLPKGLSSLQKQYRMNNLEGDITVNFYDANWYTEIIRNEGFSVRGHWRNQPTKEGYKLIFIKPFEKKGYHRKAYKDLN